MNYTKPLSEYEKELKEAKKRFDKLSKQYKKCRSAYQAEMMYDDLTILNEDIAELQMIVKELRQQKKLAELEVWQMLTYQQISLDFDMIEMICKSWMEHYNFLLGLPGNTEVDNFFYQEQFDQFKWYDVWYHLCH